MIESLLPYSNVQVYGFSDMFDIITNLDNYMDVEHYSDTINDMIIQWIYEGKGLITADNYNGYINKITTFYSSYDYESMFGGNDR